MPVFVGAGTSSFLKDTGGVGFSSRTTTQIGNLSGMVAGQVVYDSTTKTLKFYDGSNWIKISSAIPTLTGVTGVIYAGAASTLTLAGTNFLQSNLVVNFVQSSDSIDVNVTVTPSSDTAATVAVLPEAEEVDIQIKDSDLRIDVFRAGGPGGQSVNTTDSAVRITHIPSGVVVSQQDEKSQHKNKAKALKILRSRVYEAEKRKKDQERSSNRRSQIGTGDRSERIRTYNFPQGRITDHRINLTLHKLDEFLTGEIHDEMNQELRLKEQNLKLEGLK